MESGSVGWTAKYLPIAPSTSRDVLKVSDTNRRSPGSQWVVRLSRHRAVLRAPKRGGRAPSFRNLAWVGAGATHKGWCRSVCSLSTGLTPFHIPHSLYTTGRKKESEHTIFGE